VLMTSRSSRAPSLPTSPSSSRLSSSCREPENRQGARPNDPADAAATGGSGDPV